MIDYKTKIKYLLFQLGVRKTIPVEIVKQIETQENNDDLIDIKNIAEFLFSGELQKEREVWLRRTVVLKLKNAAQNLPDGVKFKIYSAYRSVELQKQKWQNRLGENKQKFPELSDEEIEILTSGQIANPNKGFGGHQTGGAVDITLCNAYGVDFDMGTKIGEHNELTKTNTPNLTREQNENRRLLLEVMEKEGFKNYPAEWWHFSYGDKMWAAYSRQEKCFYGFIDIN